MPLTARPWESEPVTIATSQKDKVEERRGPMLTYKRRAGAELVILPPLIGCRQPLTPPTPLCHDYHHFCCKTRDCCCCCCCSHSVSVFIESLLEMRWSMCWASAVTEQGMLQKRRRVLWYDLRKTRPEDRQEDELTGSYKWMEAWEDRIWHVWWSCSDWGQLMDRKERRQRDSTDWQIPTDTFCWNGEEFKMDKRTIKWYFFLLMTQVTLLWHDMQKWLQHHNKYGG